MKQFTWATVTATSPLRVQLDGDTMALPITPETLVDPQSMSVGDRVRCELSQRRVVVHGRSGGETMPVGVIQWTAALASPAGWLTCDGSAVSRTTYASLFAALNPVVGAITITVASPGVATLSGHGLFTGQMVYLTTTGALPTGLAQNTAYYVIRVNANTFRLATSLANANAGTAINTTGSQSGTHTIRRTFGVGNGSTTFNVPDLRGRTVVGRDTGQTEFDANGETGGAKAHTLALSELPGTVVYDSLGAVVGGNLGSAGAFNRINAGANVGGGAHNNLQPYMVLNPIIKT